MKLSNNALSMLLKAYRALLLRTKVNKILTGGAIAVSAMLAMNATANAATYDQTVSESITAEDSIIIGSDKNRLDIGIQNTAENPEIVIIPQDGGNVDVYAATHAIDVSNKSTTTIGSNTTSAINLNTKYEKSKTSGDARYVTGVNAKNDAELSLNAEVININVEGGKDFGARGLSIGSSLAKDPASSVTIGSGHTKELNITANGNETSMGVFSLRSHTTLKAENINITTNGFYGVLVQNNTQDEKEPTDTPPTDTATLVIDADNTVITNNYKDGKDGSGLMAFSNGYLEVKGNLEVNAFNAIDTRGHATININTDESADRVVLNGNIVFETPGASENSGEILDSNVNIHLTGSNSSWTGNVYKEYPTKEGVMSEDEKKVENLHIYLSDGAQWNAQKINYEELSKDYKHEDGAINTLNLDGGIINTAADLETIQIDNLEGTGGQINLEASLDGSKIEATTVNIGTADSKTHLDVTARGFTADDVTDVNATMQELNKKVTFTGTGESATKTNTIAEGDVVGAITQDVYADGKSSAVRVSENTKLASFKALNASAVATWRNEVAFTNQRLDFLRDHEHAYGLWAQVYGGESSFDDADLDLDTVTMQVGCDANLGNWITGVAFSYTDGDADYSNGSAEVDSYTFALYTERRFDNGFFVNGIARYGRLSTDADAGNMSASYDNNAFSIGGNVGYRFDFADFAFVEPSIGLQYAFVDGDDFTASNRVTVEQDNYSSVIGDIGARLGIKYPDNMGSVYARVYVSHDFNGDVDGKAYNDKAMADMDADIGGTWVTYGIGTQVNFTENFTVFASVDRSSGGEVDADYLLNAGVRYTF